MSGSDSTARRTLALSPRRELLLLLTLAGVQVTHILDFTIMMPLGPRFTEIFGISDAQFGMLVSAYTLAAGASGLLASTYVDRFDRKRLLVILYAGFAVATACCGLAPTYAWLMLARVASGLFGGVLGALVYTIVGEAIPFERRGRAMGVVMTAFSISSIAGVPTGLFLASTFDWHAPFLAVGLLSSVLCLVAVVTLPDMRGHLGGPQVGVVQGLRQVLTDRNHQLAFVFTALLAFTSFTVAPYITIYMQANVGLSPEQIPVIYLCGGLVTAFSARLIGVLTDRHGKVATFRVLTVAVLVPLFALTLLPRVSLPVAVMVTTLFFTLASGRMIPGRAIITSTADPRMRGTFMSLNSAVQSGSMGIAASLGGLFIYRDAAGLVQGYWRSAVLGALASLCAVWVASRLILRDAPTPVLTTPTPRERCAP